MTTSSSDTRLAIEDAPIDSLIPYWRNPRDNKEAVAKVAASIEEYGFQQPIVADLQRTIIAGHTRWAAAKTLGMTHVPVIITDLDAKRAKEYRLIDNRTSEYARWTDDLLTELREFRDDTLDMFFPHINLDLDFKDEPRPVTDGDVDTAGQAIETELDRANQNRQDTATLDFPCPHCYKPITLNRGDLDASRWTTGE